MKALNISLRQNAFAAFVNHRALRPEMVHPVLANAHARIPGDDSIKIPWKSLHLGQGLQTAGRTSHEVRLFRGRAVVAFGEHFARERRHMTGSDHIVDHRLRAVVGPLHISPV